MVVKTNTIIIVGGYDERKTEKTGEIVRRKYQYDMISDFEHILYAKLMLQVESSLILNIMAGVPAHSPMRVDL